MEEEDTCTTMEGRRGRGRGRVWQNLLIHNVYGHIHVVNGRRGGGGGEWQEGVSREEGTMYICIHGPHDHKGEVVCGGRGCGSGEEGRWARGGASYVRGAYTHRGCGSRPVVVCAFQVGGGELSVLGSATFTVGQPNFLHLQPPHTPLQSEAGTQLCAHVQLCVHV